jgi:hypothetical protein
VTKKNEEPVITPVSRSVGLKMNSPTHDALSIEETGDLVAEMNRSACPS